MGMFIKRGNVISMFYKTDPNYIYFSNFLLDYWAISTRIIPALKTKQTNKQKKG